MTCLDELAHSLESKSGTTNFKTRNSKIKTIDLYQQNELLGNILKIKINFIDYQQWILLRDKTLERRC